MRADIFHTQKCSDKVSLQGFLPLLVGFFKKRDIEYYSGIINKNIYPAEFFYNFINHFLNLRLVRDIAFYGDCLRTTGLDRFNDLDCLFLRTVVVYGDFCAFFGKKKSRGSANSPTG